MKPVVAVVDYGMGNLRSVEQAMRHAAQGEWQVTIAHSPEQIEQAQRIVLPGQGAMRDCMQHLHESGMQQAVLQAARNKPLMGGWGGRAMVRGRGRGGNSPGGGWLQGEVKRVALEQQTQSDGSRYKIPQMGWNRVRQSQPHAMWQGLPDESWFYFLHSYYACPANPAHSVGLAHYGDWFTAAIARDNLFATQFHPEKSADAGLHLYRNFLHWKP